MGLRRAARRFLARRRIARALRDARRGEAGVPPSAEGIVFSKDRPLQLFALLSSYAELVASPPPLHVLYRASAPAYAEAYDEVLRASPAPLGQVVAEARFRDDLLGLLDAVESSRIFFLVDDIVFVRPVDLAPLLALDPGRFVPSLRMGAHLSHSYTYDRPQPLPAFVARVLGDPDLLCWRWREGTLDWGYPLSVDGHLFSTGEIRVLAHACAFAAPNSFEAALQEHRRFFLDRLGVCHREARLLNVPLNKVQEEIANRAGGVDAAVLLAEWQRGRRLDHRSLRGLVNESAHQEVALSFVPRGGGREDRR
jgi:hypothetical protein